MHAPTAHDLIVVPAPNGIPMSVAEALRARLRCRGHAVDVAHAATPHMTKRYDVVILGMQYGRPQERRALGDYIAQHRAHLSRVTTGLFFIDGSRGHVMRGHVDAFSTAVSWRPDFAAALRRPTRQFVSNALCKVVASLLGGLMGSTDVATQDEVAELADRIAGEVRRVQARA